MGVALLAALASGCAQRAVVVRRWPAAEAKQGVAVDPSAFYAIASAAIGKYDKHTGRKIREWTADDGGPIVHLNSGVVVGDELFCAHSNFPAVPMRSSIEVFSTATLAHVRGYDLGTGQGSATWVDFHDGAWWVAFGQYSGKGGELGKGSEDTTLRRYDAGWRELGAWTYPPQVVAKWRGKSNSGGIWLGQRLYTTGHSAKELFVLELPRSGSMLKLVATVKMESAGQGVAFDPAAELLYSIQRSTKEVIASRLPATTDR